MKEHAAAKRSIVDACRLHLVIALLDRLSLVSATRSKDNFEKQRCRHKVGDVIRRRHCSVDHLFDGELCLASASRSVVSRCDRKDTHS